METHVTELVQLRNLGISITDLTWSRLKISSPEWICILRKKGFTSLATCINRQSSHVRSFQTDGLTSAQVNPERDVVALATKSNIFIVCLNEHKCLSWHSYNQEIIEYWAWISRNVIVLVGQNNVYMWNYATDLYTTLFKRHIRIRNCQITQCVADSSLSWFALTSLTGDRDGSVVGVTQIYSSEYDNSNCIEAHSAAIVDYKLSSRINPSRLLITSKKSSTLAKVSLSELGPIQNGNVLISRVESFPWRNPHDIPCHLVCDPIRGLIFVVSKMGSLFIFTLESCLPLILHQRICPDIIIGCVLDRVIGGIVVSSRNGQVLSITIEGDKKRCPAKSEGILMKSTENHFCEQVTRL